VVFWFLNIGLVIFVVGMVTETAIIKQVGAPTMGLAALLGVATMYARLWPSSLPADG
jgi:hypothetical protein